jgi:hypothetical protein
MLAVRRHRRKQFWINLFAEMGPVLDIDYDSLRCKEVSEFFYLLNHAENKSKK